MAENLDSTTNSETLNPTSSNNRILHLDIFRGFAILGIFMVNILVMNVSFVYRGAWLMETSSTINDAAYWFLEMFFFSKFFPIFSFLFGIGVALQIRSLKMKPINSSIFLTRRFLALLVFGVSHILFIWSGDILHLYALFGFVLILMYRTPPIVILLSAFVLVFFPYFDDMYVYITKFFEFDPEAGLIEYSRTQIADLKTSGSYVSGMELRIAEYGFMSTFVISIIVPFALAMTLLGLYTVKKGIIDRIDAFVTKIVGPFLLIFILILSFRFVYRYWMIEHLDIEYGSLLSFFLWTLYYVSEIFIAFFYLIVIVFVLRTKVGLKLLSPLQYVGRMAFTNYILQSIIGYLIMRTFGYYESFTPSNCMIIVLTVYACQIPLSWLWLKYFKFGPLEWVWRCISYWKILPIKKA